MLMHRWMLRETDLWKYTRSLQELDKMRVEGKFVDSDGNKPKGQYVSGYLLPQWLMTCLTNILLYLLQRCYGIIYTLLSSSKPISEELIPIVSTRNHSLKLVLATNH